VPAPHQDPRTRQYTAQPAPAQVPAPVAQRRPGPSPKVAIPVLLTALVCFAIGIWALTQI
jgi:hypothetical protein